MTPIREAVVLPLVFLTVVLLGGLRIAGDVRFVAPPLMALVLGLLAVASLVRSSALRPEAFMNAGRTGMENVSGAIVLLTLYAASAQVFHLVIPERGLLHLIFGTFFFIQLLTTMAGGTGRTGMLRSFVVLLGSAFILRWVVLESLYAPDTGFLQRLVTTLAGGITLGAMEYAPHTAMTGYTAFFAVALYLVGLALLAPPAPPAALVPVLADVGRNLPVAGMLAALLIASGCSAAPQASTPPSDPEVAAAMALRADVLRRTRVWQPPQVPIAEANLAENPRGGFRSDETVDCAFTTEPVGGTTPKFYCRLADGRELKVKYGTNNPELPAEVAATRLLAALGFGADRMFVVRAVRCAGCPPFPFQALRCYERTGWPTCLAGGNGRVREFRAAVIEERLEGRRIEVTHDQGWSWDELTQIDEAAGGASRTELDGFRLLAVVLAHWDNKGANQRLLCPAGDEPCARPLAMMQDVGATFGPTKLDLPNWSRARIWTDPRACTVSMADMPWDGATFPDHQISEGGRRFLLQLLEELSDSQLRELFLFSGVTSYEQVSARARDPQAWVEVFRDKVRQIRDAGPCPD
jgi:hypothetical protein